jgi:hypothetical protein
MKFRVVLICFTFVILTMLSGIIGASQLQNIGFTDDGQLQSLEAYYFWAYLPFAFLCASGFTLVGALAYDVFVSDKQTREENK